MMSADGDAMQEHLRSSGYQIRSIDPNNSRKYDSSIPLILPNDHEYDLKTKSLVKKANVQRTNLYLVPEALELLKLIKSPLAILAICGPMRTGKSYILSRLLGEVDAFDLGHTFDPKTFGIWMGTKILLGKDKNGKEQAVLLLDTEGIDAPGANVTQDAGILVLTILISSILIYNSQNVPYKKDLEKLDCFVRLAEGFEVKRNQEIEVGEISQYFPHFIWLLRDVSLITSDDGHGGEMDPTDYIKERVLSRGKSFKAGKADEVGRAIISFFPDIECKTLPTPHSDEKVMQNIAQHTNDLNPKFQKGVQDFMSHLIKKIQINGAKHGYQKGSAITGSLLCGLLHEYVKAVNDPNAIPCLDNAWQNTVDLLRKETIEELTEKYKTSMTARIKAASVRDRMTFPLEEDGASVRGTTLMALHDEILKALTKELLEKVAHFGAGDVKDLKKNSAELVKVFQKKIVELRRKKAFTMDARGNRKEYEGMEVCGGVLLEYIRINRTLSTEFCTKLYQELFAPIRGKIEHEIETYTFKQLEADFIRLNEEYLKRAIGPEKWNVLSEMDKKTVEAQKMNFKKLKGYQEKVMEERRRAKEAEIEARKREEELTKLHQENVREKEKNAENLRNMQENFQTQIEKMREEENRRIEDERKKLEDLQKSNFAEFQDMVKEFNESQSRGMEAMMENLRLEREQSKEQMGELVKAIANIPPPVVKVERGRSCSIM
ncbi:guanylate-binding protein 1-like [Dendronephthya gigantea]|uniref:guanylate-binding protein 1-like n=1 Tax=Dendronephthya gigantea TaxID=151771 RepID=UPI0010692FEA|nr:guanylate-binding protein 1-like [Dendronephthya gigantea]